MKIRAGNLCEIQGGVDEENVNWPSAGHWITAGNPIACPAPTHTATIAGGNINVSSPITITTLTSNSKKLKATWSGNWTAASYGSGYTVSPNSGGYTVAPNTGGMPPGAINTVYGNTTFTLPLGIHCSIYTEKKEHRYSQPDANGNIYPFINPAETKFMRNGTIGLIVHVDKGMARMLIEERLYLVPIEKLKVIS